MRNRTLVILLIIGLIIIAGASFLLFSKKKPVYYCEEGILDNNKCKIEEDIKEYTISCPEDFELNEEQTKCFHNVIIPAKTAYGCPSGYFNGDNKCVSDQVLEMVPSTYCALTEEEKSNGWENINEDGENCKLTKCPEKNEDGSCKCLASHQQPRTAKNEAGEDVPAKDENGNDIIDTICDSYSYEESSRAKQQGELVCPTGAKKYKVDDKCHWILQKWSVTKTYECTEGEYNEENKTCTINEEEDIKKECPEDYELEDNKCIKYNSIEAQKK